MRKKNIQQKLIEKYNNFQPQFIVDGKGHKKLVVLHLEEYASLLEDIEDLAIIAERKENEETPFEELEAKLKKDGRI